jgi:hypothetical protein
MTGFDIVAALFCLLFAVSARRDAMRVSSLLERTTTAAATRVVGTETVPKRLPYRTADNPEGDPVLAVEMAESRQRFVEGERDAWRREAERYKHALHAVAQLNHAGCCGIATQALKDEDDS